MKHTFIYNIINDKVIQRKICILETLNNGGDFVSSQYMANLLQCTVRTVVKDISELKRELPDNWNIIGVANKGYVLHKPLTESLYVKIGDYLSQSIIYRVIIKNFNNRHYTLEKWSQIIYMNKKTLKDKLKVYAHILNESNINFKYEQLELSGKEFNIRYYYCVFFYTTGKYINYSVLPVLLKRKLLFLFNSHSIIINHEAAIYIIYVFISRIMNKKYISESLDISFFNEEYVLFFNSIISIIEDFYKIKLHENEKKALMFFLFFVIKLDYSELVIDCLKLSYQKLYKRYEKLICLLTDSNVHTETGKKLFSNLLHYLLKVYFYNRNHIAIGYVFEPLHDSQSILLHGYNKNLSEISYWNKSFCNGIFNNREIEFIATHATLIINSTFKKHVLFLFAGNNAMDKIMYSKLKKGLGNNIKIYRQPNDDLKFDIIISNYKHERVNTPTIYISETLCEKEILLIRNLIYA
ncbi:helix-turn-helix domain-containing protein [Bacillus cereus]|uniref:helix-turn-helix domain-containing protein n=1 Tax=Bacillus cereus TaxID=1396 RepID=UPI001D0EB489|nr:helix-turn-helix domain containing protein [Bacillus cereus]MCC2364682.1 helix-turn-helix domain-containing protein [Bacillus cereus]